MINSLEGEGVLSHLTRQDVPLNRVSFYGKNYVTGYPFLIKSMLLIIDSGL